MSHCGWMNKIDGTLPIFMLFGSGVMWNRLVLGQRFALDAGQARPLKPRYRVSLQYGVRRRPRRMLRSGGSRAARSRSYMGGRRHGGGDPLERADAGEQISSGGAGEELS